jgi:cytochrome c-type biogenesis protein CcmE
MILSNRKLWAIGGMVVILSGFGYLIYGGIGENLVYFLTPAELQEKGEAAYDVPVKLGGMVVPGTVRWDAQRLDLRFKLSDGTKNVEVHSTKSPPQMFREQQGVVVEGKLNRNGVFESTNLMVKHSNEYRPPADHDAKRKDLLKTLMRESGSQ